MFYRIYESGLKTGQTDNSNKITKVKIYHIQLIKQNRQTGIIAN